MAFPESQRVTYRNNPLETVICQLRFPPVLRIETELPAHFQEAIRNQYPIFNEAATIDQHGLPQDMLNMVRSLLPTIGKAYEFSTEDRVWKLTLSKDSIALECSDYKTWEEFLGQLLAPVSALIENYIPTFFSRIGLRYVNVIRRSRLGLQTTPWAMLLKPPIGAEQRSSVAPDVVESTHRFLVNINEQGDQVRIRHGLILTQDTPPELAYLIDNDFFSERKTETQNARAKLEELHRESGNCFRWCIDDPLHRAMDPHSLDTVKRGA